MSAVKVFDPFPRKVGTSLAEFSHYWMTWHADLAKSFLQLLHYTQNMRLEDKPASLGAPLAETPCDGSAETWFESAQAVQDMVNDPRFPMLMEDERQFMETGAPRHLLMTEEHVLDSERFDTRMRGIKVLVFARRAVGTDQSAFLAEWGRDDAVSLGRTLGATRHVACATVGDVEMVDPTTGQETPHEPDDAPYDAVRELWWRDLAALREASEREPEAWVELIRPSVIDAPRSYALLAHERIIVP
jgi:hypothetical protein